MEHNFDIIDLFSGAGGLSYGFKKAGFNVILANEIDPVIANSYRKNHPDTIMLNLDIKKLVENFEETIEEAVSNKKREFKDSLNKIKVIVGGPPCQGFSMSGGRIRKSKEFIEDERNYLFKSYFHIIQKFEPDFFVFENVTGILSSHKGDIIKQIKSIFSDESNFRKGAYHLSINILNAADFGIPQIRRRVLIIGSKHPFDFEKVRKETLDSLSQEKKEKFIIRTTVKDAIGDLLKISPYEENEKPNHIATKHNLTAIRRMSKIKPNENWTSLDENIKSIHSGSYGRLDWDKPSTTITTRFDTPSAGRYIHPELNRTLTPREAARLQSFPDDFVFYGSKSSICTQIGNAVPPQLAEFIALMIKKVLNEKIK